MHVIPPCVHDADLDEADIARLQQVLDATLARPAGGVGDVLAKLHALASFYEGGEVPALNLSAIAAELSMMLAQPALD